MATDPARPVAELTLRGIVLGAAITMLFTAANVYAGLKVGLTFATSIPAAVVSMAILRFFKGSSILENNIVQTIASAAGTLAAIVFVLPGLIMVGWWSGFPYWTTVLVCITGGVLGVMFSVPLRRALVTDGLRKIGLWMTEHRVASVAWPSEPFDPFFNVNTQDDAREANRIARQFG